MSIIALYLPTNEVKIITESDWVLKQHQKDIQNNLVYQFLSIQEDAPVVIAQAAPQIVAAKKKSGCNCKK